MVSNIKFLLARGMFLGFILGKEGIKTDPLKIATINNWPI